MAKQLPKYYIYLIIDPVENKCRYVGKGHGRRAKDQVNSDKIKNPKLKDLIIQRAKEGIEIQPQIVYRHNIEAEVLRKEIALVARYGREGIDPEGTLFNITTGGQGIAGRGTSVSIANILYSTIKEAADAYDVNEYSVRRRLSKGWTPEQAVGIEYRPLISKLNKPVKVAGVSYSSQSEACKKLGISVACVIARLKRGWTPEQAFGIEKRLPKQNRPIIIDHKEFESITEAAAYYHVKTDTALARVKRGWTPEEAFGVKRRRRADQMHTESEVVDMRMRCSQGQSFADIAKYYGIHPSSVSIICRGLSYRQYPGPISPRKQAKKEFLAEDTVRIIKEIREQGSKIKEIAEIYNIDSSRVSNICTGKSYYTAGGPLTKGQRRLSDNEKNEIIKAITGRKTFHEIAKEFNVHVETVRKISKLKRRS